MIVLYGLYVDEPLAYMTREFPVVFLMHDGQDGTILQVLSGALA